MTTNPLQSAEYIGHIPLNQFYTYNEYDAEQPNDEQVIDRPPLCAIYKITAKKYNEITSELFCVVKDREATEVIKNSLPEFLGDQIPNRLNRARPILHSYEYVTTAYGGNRGSTERRWTVIGDTTKDPQQHKFSFWRHSNKVGNLFEKRFPVVRTVGRNSVVEHSIDRSNWEGPKYGPTVNLLHDSYEFATNSSEQLPEEMKRWVKQPVDIDGQINEQGNFSLSPEVKVVASRQKMLEELELWSNKTPEEKKNGFLVACKVARKDGNEKLEIWHCDGSKPLYEGYSYSNLPAIPKLLMRSLIIQPKQPEEPIQEVNKTPPHSTADATNQQQNEQPSHDEKPPITPQPAKQSFCSWLLTPLRWFLGLFGIRI